MPPQSGILRMHKIDRRPVVIAGKIEVRPIMYLALSAPLHASLEAKRIRLGCAFPRVLQLSGLTADVSSNHT